MKAFFRFSRCGLPGFFLLVLFSLSLACCRKQGAELSVPSAYRENGLYSYALENERAYRAAMALYESLTEGLPKLQEGRGLKDPDFALAIVFPEMLRYSAFRNGLEYLATCFVYGLSPSFGGCTIGHFQMNAPFAETIERYVSLSPRLQSAYPSIDFAGSNRRVRDRMQRVGRINDRQGEADYLAAFIAICTEKFALDDMEAEDRLVLLATAYNAGMSRTREELEQVSVLDSYPSGLNSPKSRWNYAAIALEFYQGRKKLSGGE